MNIRLPRVILNFIEKPPLLQGECREHYYDFLETVISSTKPSDMIEWFWTLRFTDGSWHVLRLYRLRAVYLNSRHRAALHGVILKTKLPLTGSWPSGVYDRLSNEAEKEIAQWLNDPGQFTQHGLDPDIVPAMAVVQGADTLEKFGRMIEQAETRLRRRHPSTGFATGGFCKPRSRSGHQNRGQLARLKRKFAPDY
jgi:hypothetical protein